MTPYVDDGDVRLYHGDALETLRQLPDVSVDCCVTSPPYWGLRDYGHAGQLGLERTPDEYVARLVELFGEVRRVLRAQGTLWLNLGDSYVSVPGSQRQGANGEMAGRSVVTARVQVKDTKAAGGALAQRPPSVADIRPKNLVGIPWRVAFALQADGWWLRSDIVWSKPNPMPESVTDRPTKSHEYVFLLAKSESYYFGQDDLREPAAWERWGDQTVKKPQPGTASWIKPKTKQELVGKRTYDGFNGRWDESVANGEAPTSRNVRSVWEIPTQPYPGAHFAVFPQELARRCILGGCPPGGTVLDPFAGSGTTLHVARTLERNAVGIELNADYCRLASERLQQLSLLAEGAP